MGEKVEKFDSIVAAGERACKWLGLNPDNRHDKQILDTWQIYKGTMEKSKAYGRPCGIGEPRPDNALWIVRLDYDPEKGIHFNARKPNDQNSKLAAGWNHPASEDEYSRQLNGIAGLDAQQIWKRWNEGRWIGPVPTTAE